MYYLLKFKVTKNFENDLRMKVKFSIYQHFINSEMM